MSQFFLCWLQNFNMDLMIPSKHPKVLGDTFRTQQRKTLNFEQVYKTHLRPPKHKPIVQITSKTHFRLDEIIKTTKRVYLNWMLIKVNSNLDFQTIAQHAPITSSFKSNL